MRDEDWDAGDAPWWYNERASLSQLAGAIWLNGGWAFEEFATRKRRRRGKGKTGRGDLMFELNSYRFIAEAKQCWPPLGRTPTSAFRRVARFLGKAKEDATMLRGYGYHRMAIVFVSPRIIASARSELDRRVNAFVKSFEDLDRTAVAWAFPKRDRYPRTRAGYLYPGTVVVLKPLRHG